MDTKEFANSTIKSLFAAIPFAGQPLNELFYDYRGRVKQNRLNEFSSLLSAYFEIHSPVDFSALNAVEFGDLFESVIQRVAYTGSREKHKRFRDILIGYLEHPQQTMEHSDTFLELVSILTEPSILILKYHYHYMMEFDRLDSLDKAMEVQVRKADHDIETERSKKQLGQGMTLIKWKLSKKSESVNCKVYKRNKKHWVNSKRQISMGLVTMTFFTSSRSWQAAL